MTTYRKNVRTSNQFFGRDIPASELDGFGAPGEELDIPASELDEFSTLSIEERYVRLKSIQDPEESLNTWREIRNSELTIQAINGYELLLEHQAPSTTNSSRA